MVHWYQMDLFFIYRGKIHLGSFTYSNQYISLTCVSYKKHSLYLQQLRWQQSLWNYLTINTESLFELQYINGISTKPVSQNKADAEWSMPGRTKKRPSSLLHCIYIFMKNLIYSRSIRNLSISIIIVFNQFGSCV